MADSEHLTRLLSRKKYLKVAIWFYVRAMIIVGAHFYPIVIQSIGIATEDNLLERRRQERNIPARVEARQGRLEQDINQVSARFESGEISKAEEEEEVALLNRDAERDIQEIENEVYDDTLFSEDYLNNEDRRRLNDSFSWSLLAMALLRWILQMTLLGLWGWWWRGLYTVMMIVSVIGHVFIVNRIGSIRAWYITDLSFTLFSMAMLFYEWMVGFL